MANKDFEDEDRKEIALVAYTYWQSRGYLDGHDVEDWLMAEEEVFRRHALDAIETRAAGDRHKEARTAA